MNLEIANRLVKLRKENGFSQEELAEKIGISRQAVSKWERAEASPDTDNLIRLARLYGVSLDALLATEEELPPTETEEASPKAEDPCRNCAGFPKECHGCEKKSGKRNPLHIFPYPIAITALYLLLGYCLNWWHPGWILFLTIPVYYAVADWWGRRKGYREE